MQIGAHIVSALAAAAAAATTATSSTTPEGPATSRPYRPSGLHAGSSGSPTGESDEDESSAPEEGFEDEAYDDEAAAHAKEEHHIGKRVKLFDAEDSEANVRFTRLQDAGNYVGLGIPGSDGGAQAVIGGTLAKLFQYATSERYADRNYVEAFVMSHRWFVDDLSMLRLLKARYVVHRTGPGCADWATFKRTRLAPVRFRCVNFLKSWLQLCGDDFRRNVALANETRRFIDRTVGGDTPSGQALSRALDKALLASDVGLEFTLPKPPPRLAYEATLAVPPASFLDVPPEEIARQLAAREWRLWHAIRMSELLPGAWTGQDKERRAPHVVKMIRSSNERTNWVIWELLRRKDLKERATALNHIIGIAEYSLRLQNYNAVMEIFAGLQSVPIHRLKHTWDLLTPKAADTMERLEHLWDAEGNWANFREALTKAAPPCIPYLGFFLTDLTFIYDGNPSKIPDTELINFGKWRTVAVVLKEISRFHKCPMNYKKNKQIGALLTPTDLNFDDDAQWDASVALEDKST